MAPDLRSTIAASHATGVSCSEIARRLDVAAPTVTYHLRRLSTVEGRSPDTGGPEVPQHVRSEVSTRGAIAELLATGATRARVARELGLAKATVGYHARRLGGKIDTRCARRYDRGLVQRYYDEGHSVRECIAAFGFSSASWFDAVKRGAVRARPAGMPIDELLRADAYRGRHVKTRLIAAGLKEYRCEGCGLTEWRAQPITLALHHVNGIRNDNRLENLQLLCPNCHSQTDTFAGRNGRERSPPDAGDIRGGPGARAD